MVEKVELLAPAGGYETMVGAFNAGADAVYLGGSKFGARAYADNFDKDQVVEAIRYAHLHDKKVYMTVNTLVKEREFNELYDFMLPFAENRLDGVIVQDLGVMRFIRDEFPQIELHASTQQTVTGVNGARLLKKLGCCRVVPARELSLLEMKAIREQADIEVEAFIHGAMCYCYSGVCLFSSMLGNRSGNRGRCAQPCRLPYRLSSDKKEVYPLSLKDMCTINMVPELIRAGIDSFKIEGRMKRPEYAAGVTSLYRKYIDLYYADPEKEIQVSDEDLRILKSLYLRTGISEGYYHQHNGKNMVTISSPAYNGTSDEVLKDIKDKYLNSQLKIKCRLFCDATMGEPLSLSMSIVRNGEELEEHIQGNIIMPASKRPMDVDAIKEKLSRLGGTAFEAEEISVTIDDKGNPAGIFVPVSELNELRRTLTDKMLERLLDNSSEASLEIGNRPENSSDTKSTEIKCRNDYHVLVNTRDQLKAAVDKALVYEDITRIYVDSDLFFSMEKETAEMLSLDMGKKNIEFIVALPFVTRKENFDGTKDIISIAENAEKKGFCGVLVRNIEQLGILSEIDFSGKVIPDYGVYVWNEQAAELLMECNKLPENHDFEISEFTMPYELTIHESKELVRRLRENMNIPLSYQIYGRVPMMISAGCVKKTMDKCSGKLNQFNKENLSMTDRMGNDIRITTNCRNCYNIIWNAAPTSLHKKLDNIRNMQLFDHFRIDFSIEDYKESQRILDAFLSDNKENRKILDDMEYTTGHFKRGVE
ncbi:peptidase U32 family protein [Butyrivibrio sp. YAB3001]|uniref:peptidase U32 family protein n=1 Tax=Butyrivibrio sp. YAB3001 TaxID=1520812 RepID=UPI0008F69046|nr:U32 family peptidase [Butyrivibrio sp. YAB3001]SFC35751.1 putative protease [Butyrivibrio sp. YAB3001]